MNVVFIHGRSQQGKNTSQLERAWRQALDEGTENASLSLPSSVAFHFPFYGDLLGQLIDDLQAASPAAVNIKGDAGDEKALDFLLEVASELAESAQIDINEVRVDLPGDVIEKGFTRWRWVHAVFRRLEECQPLSSLMLESLFRDVHLYLTNTAIAMHVDQLVREKLDAVPRDGGPCVVVCHSLGSVIAYRVLKAMGSSISLDALITLGSPLGLRAIRRRLDAPLENPEGVKRWLNAYDIRDVVALRPLDAKTWPIEPPIENYGGVTNDTEGSHGVVGYLNDAQIATWVHNALAVHSARP